MEKDILSNFRSGSEGKKSYYQTFVQTQRRKVKLSNFAAEGGEIFYFFFGTFFFSKWQICAYIYSQNLLIYTHAHSKSQPRACGAGRIYDRIWPRKPNNLPSMLVQGNSVTPLCIIISEINYITVLTTKYVTARKSQIFNYLFQCHPPPEAKLSLLCYSVTPRRRRFFFLMLPLLPPKFSFRLILEISFRGIFARVSAFDAAESTQRSEIRPKTTLFHKGLPS